MRILVDLQACQSASRRRGIGRYSLALADALVAGAGTHEVSLLVNAAFPDSVESLRARFDGRVPRERIHVFATPVPVAGIGAANRWRACVAEPIREAVIASQRPDVVLVSSLFEGFVDDATTSLATSAQSLRVVTLYDLIPLLRDDTLASAEARTWYERKLASLRNADLLLAISRHARDEAVSALGVPDTHIAVISAAADACFRPGPVDAEAVRDLRFRFGIDGDYVLYSGGFDPRKNVGRLIEAYAQLPEALRARCRLVLAGRADERERRELALVASRAGLRAHECMWTGYVTDAELAALYRACAAFVFPSLHEGFGLPVLEAMSCGAAVLASNATSIPEVVGRSDALFDPADTAAIAGRLERVLRDDAFRGALREHGLARAAQFSWAATGRRALEAIEEAFDRRHASVRSASSRGDARPSLAFVSPLPPEKTGIAAYSAELLAPLREHYRIDVVTDQSTIDLPSALADLPARTSDWFAANGERYDRVVYQMGNSPFHQRMFALLERHPGVVVLHDVHLGGVLNWMDATGVTPGIFERALLESHGYAALAYAQAAGRDAAIDRYPCSLRVIDDADGIVVHSEHAIDVARASFRIAADDWRAIPQLRRLPDLGARDAARGVLGLRSDDLLFASFGFLDATKLDHRIVDAWLASPLAADPRCMLVFVGQNHGGEYGRVLAARIAAADARIRITGFVDAATFDRYLLAADAAIQLRGVSRGETSRSALDCLAHALPLVANASGSLAELPGEVLLRLPAEFADAELAEALTRLASEHELRERLANSARRYIAKRHDPARVAAALRDAVEHFAVQGPQQRHRQLVSAVARAAAGAGAASDDDWCAAAQAIASNRRRSRPRQLFVDVTALAKQDLRSGIERVSRSVLRELLRRPPEGCLVEPVVAAKGCYAYARRFTAKWLELPPVPVPDAPIDTAPGDVFFGLDWAADVVPSQEAVLARYRTLGVRMAFLIHDLLPIRAPQFYPPGIDAMHSTWLHSVARVADGVFCVSNAVADDFVAWLNEEGPERASPLGIDILPPAADVEHSVPSRGMPEDADALLAKIGARPALLMVGTVEPRKGHAQALAACDALWRAGDDVGLVIVGRQGWLVDDLAERLRRHEAGGQRLFWFESASDEWLDALYARAAVLLAPSYGEGFGLPLIEAARRGTPLLVRDLPVFREVAGEHATYFTGSDAEDLAVAIRRWQDARARGALPDSSRIAPRRWRQSVECAARVMLEDRWSRRWRSCDAAATAGAAQRTRFDVDFSRAALSPAVHAIEGLSGPENWGRWSDANLRRSVEIRFRAPIPARGTVTLTARAFGPNVGQPIRLRIGGHEAQLRFGAHETTASETYAVHAPSRVLEIEPPHPARPCDLAASRDDRRLGIGLVRLTIVPA